LLLQSQPPQQPQLVLQDSLTPASPLAPTKQNGNVMLCYTCQVLMMQLHFPDMLCCGRVIWFYWPGVVDPYDFVCVENGL